MAEKKGESRSGGSSAEWLTCLLGLVILIGIPVGIAIRSPATVVLIIMVGSSILVACAAIAENNENVEESTFFPVIPADKTEGVPVSGPIGRLVLLKTADGMESLAGEETGTVVWLRPVPVPREEFQRRIKTLRIETTTYRAEETSPEIIMARAQQVLQESGFHILVNDRQTVKGQVQGRLEGWGEFSRSGQVAAAIVSVSGRPDTPGSICELSVYCNETSIARSLHGEVSMTRSLRGELFNRLVHALPTTESSRPGIGAKQPLRPKPQPFAPGSTEYEEQSIAVVRRADFLEDSVKVIVEVTNKSTKPITDVSVRMSSYSVSSMELSSDDVLTNHTLEPNTSWSVEFDLKPTMDCIQDEISIQVGFEDANGMPRGLAVEPIPMREVCSLVVPESIDDRELERRLAGMESGEITISIESMSSREMHLKTLAALKQLNFHQVSSDMKEAEGLAMGEVNGWARGKYTRKGVGLSMVVYGSSQGIGCSCRIIVSAEEDRVILPALQEVRHTLEI